MFRALYDWTLRLASHRHAIRSMAVISFCESSFFPIPPDVMVVPMVLARRDQAYLIATVCTISSVLGGMLGYAIGMFIYDSVGQRAKAAERRRAFEQQKAEGKLSEAEFLAMDAEVMHEVERAVSFAEAGTWEPVEDLLKDVVTP